MCQYEEPVDYWAEDPELCLADWQYEVANGDTRLGYWDWVYAHREVDCAN